MSPTPLLRTSRRRAAVLIILMCAALATGCNAAIASDRADGSEAQVRVMTWNIRYDNPDDGVHAWPLRREELLAVVAAQDVDILCIQEGLQHQVRYLQEGMEGYAVRGVGRDDGREKGEYTAIYFRENRFTYKAGGTFWLSPTPDEPSRGWDAALPRIATWVQLRDTLAGTDLYVFNTHFDHMGVRARENSAALLRVKVRAIAGDAPCVLAGDFNTGDRDSCYRILTARDGAPPFFHDAMHRSILPPAGPRVTYTGFPFTSSDQQDRIDFIFVNDATRVRRHVTLDARRRPGYISDHLPVMADIVIHGRM